MIEQGGVKVDGQKVADKALKLAVGGPYVLQVGMELGSRSFAYTQAVSSTRRTYSVTMAPLALDALPEFTGLAPLLAGREAEARAFTDRAATIRTAFNARP